MATDNFISREDILSGRLRLDRRPARLLAAIEARCAYMRRESRRAIEAYFLGDAKQFRRQFELDYIQELRLQAELPTELTEAWS